MTTTPIPKKHSFTPIEETPVDLVQCVTIACAEDWHRLKKAAAENSEPVRGVILLDVRMPSPGPAFLDDFTQWARDRCSTYGRVVLLVDAAAADRLSRDALVFRQAPHLAEDLSRFFHAFLCEDNTVRCDLDDLVYALGRQGLCQLSPAQVMAADSEADWRSFEAALTTGLSADTLPHWLIVCRTPTSLGKVAAPLRHLLRHLMNQNKEAIAVSAISADLQAPFSLTVLRRI